MQVHFTEWARLRGYAGWLMCDPGFREHLNEVHGKWLSIESSHRPPFPFGGDLTMGLPRGFEIEGQRVFSVAREALESALNAFLERWNLVQMTTWDLPLPYLPLLTQKIWDHTRHPPHSVYLALPLHYPLQGSDSILEEVARQQRLLAEEADLDASVAGLPHHAMLGQMFEVQHLEQKSFEAGMSLRGNGGSGDAHGGGNRGRHGTGDGSSPETPKSHLRLPGGKTRSRPLAGPRPWLSGSPLILDRGWRRPPFPMAIPLVVQ